MHLTRGFDGEAALSVYSTAAEQARAIAATVVRQQAGGCPLAAMAILVRLTAQTPPTGCASACANAWGRRRGAPATGFPTLSSTPMAWAAAWSTLNVGET
jgi:hypothetical protein